ncbi:homolog to NAD(P)H dehydrogenase (quinone) [Natrialba magadii ATCC 43099]|uniref:Homolog to NAD(P)H dehydrogenase (Quinone) n=1 Tax=Natrialba magadii (strain ATCC 43099 / DSM 3394 / CCM 3739 / CIP 104546 / IAM 13178 / JCM 8861 / NBRC 102185 / NCIMB 2190 / MS3) TaxID=547559 RepID=D3SVB7_NATMM|nr:NADPH-dependent FMN reductase [Natrialba magadii]ADD05525.1 homolog to NAD(P)H dehydrogenase (quinone) [Natrialba magadii ATCC 43099]ELY29513.1 NADPH-dependent FMN reductase [Natrialba magadii ATCC 43099]
MSRSTPSVLAVSGSLRDESYTRTALQYALRAAAEAGAETTLLDLREYDLPLYDPNVDEQGDEQEVKALMREADAVALGTPVYHGSYSGALKNFHDYCGWDEYEDTTVGLLATAGGGSYGSTLDHLRITVRGVHGWVLPHQVGLRNANKKFEKDPDAIDGRRFRDTDLQERVEKLGWSLTEYAFIDPSVTSTRAAGDD